VAKAVVTLNRARYESSNSATDAVRSLPTVDIGALRLSYDTVGVTLDASFSSFSPPRGFRTYEGTARIGEGADAWAFASDAVMRWGVKTRSGFDIRTDADEAAPDPRVTLDRFWLMPRVGPLPVREPVEVIGIVDETDRKGFAYGTLAGHPVSGEEAFVVSRAPDGSVWITVRSLTGPSTGRWKYAWPGVLIGQRIYRRRYLRALRS
jgi:uncharacterized protein (UPF0548 family)